MHHDNARIGQSLNGRRAFTLIELLVVITIIAILAGMLMPAIKMVQASARSAKCSSNLRMLQLGNSAYANDYEGNYVPMFYGPVGTTFLYQWVTNSEFASYAVGSNTTSTGVSYKIDSPSGMLCPLSKPPSSIFLNIGYSYGYNGVVYPSKTSFGPCNANTATPKVFQKVAFTDGLKANLRYPSADAYGTDGYFYGGSPVAEGALLAVVAYRHRSKANVVFYDGHVEPMEPKILYVKSLWE